MSMHRAYTEFLDAAAIWREPIEQVEVLIAAMKLNAALASKHPAERKLWGDFALQLQSALESADAAMAVGKGERAIDLGDEDALQEAADQLFVPKPWMAGGLKSLVDASGKIVEGAL